MSSIRTFVMVGAALMAAGAASAATVTPAASASTITAGISKSAAAPLAVVPVRRKVTPPSRC